MCFQRDGAAAYLYVGLHISAFAMKLGLGSDTSLPPTPHGSTPAMASCEKHGSAEGLSCRAMRASRINPDGYVLWLFLKVANSQETYNLACSCTIIYF